MPDTVTTMITKLGAQGDGVAMIDGQPVFVPFTLPGDTVRVAGKGNRRKVVSVLDPAAERVDPFCRHFGACGGCQLQHMAGEAYKNWKTGLLDRAFAAEAMEIATTPLLQFDRASRRRAVLTARKTENDWSIGFAERGSHRLVDVKNCPVFTGSLNAALLKVRPLLEPFNTVKGDVRVHILAAVNGADIAFSFSGKHPSGLVRAVTTSAAAKAFVRLSINGETVLESQRPLLSAGSGQVSPPPGGFVQASQAAETAMADLVCGHLGECRKVADLFSGHGTFALRLAQNSVVHAAENSTEALAALDQAWRATGGKLKAISHEKRDLFRRPMMAKELKPFQGVVFDPPRAGAEAQARELAKSNVQQIAAVSCNPATLARDIRLLTGGGYKIVSVTPIDQFAFTPHLEAVVLLER